jgi:hypothetical protein
MEAIQVRLEIVVPRAVSLGVPILVETYEQSLWLFLIFSENF